jgi:hypothetical protein
LDKVADELTKQGEETSPEDLVTAATEEAEAEVESNRSLGDLLRDDCYINKLRSRRIPLEERKDFFLRIMTS